MASSRIVGTNENISTYDSAGGKDYSSLAAWESATDYDLVSAATSEVLETYSGVHDDTITLAGAVSSASYLRIIRPAGTIGDTDWEGHSAVPLYDNTCTAFRTTADGTIFSVEEAFVSIQDIVISSSYTGANTVTGINAIYSDLYIIGVIFDSITSTIALGFNSVPNAGNTYLYNCLFNNITTAGAKANAPLTTSYFYYKNCTFVNNGIGCDNQWNGVADAINCVSESNTTNWNGTISKTTCTDDDGVSFLDSGSKDFRLAPGDSAAIDNGTDLSAFFTDDIVGTARPLRSSWDIGFHEEEGNIPLSLYDSIAITEDVQCTFPLLVTAYDTVSIGGYVFTSSVLFLSSVDSISVVEDLTVATLLEKFVSIYDSISVSESVYTRNSGYLVNGIIEISCEAL